jgi:hypothetical protein
MTLITLMNADIPNFVPISEISVISVISGKVLVK